MDQPLAPVDILGFDSFDEDAEPEVDTTPLRPVITGRAPGVVAAGSLRFGAGAAAAMPDPMIPPTGIKPAYGLVGVPDQAVTTRDVKVFVGGFSLGAVVAVVFSWLGRRSSGY